MIGPRERVGLDPLLGMALCLALSLVTQVATLPVWVSITVVAGAGLRLLLASRGRDAPPAPIRFVVAAFAIGLLFFQFRTFNGLTAGTALLCLIAGLKFLETRTHRDVYVIAMIIYFLCLAALLDSESFWLLSYLLLVCWLTTATLLRLRGTTGAPRRDEWRASAKLSGKLLLQALPVALAFWLFFPRFGGPLWQLPDNGGAAQSGLGDSMTPGDITDLANSDEIAFRVRFAPDSMTPRPGERYWRGPVLHDFDGRAWRRNEAGPARAPRLNFQGPAYHYTVNLEPNQHNWLFVLDWPSQWDTAQGSLTADYMLVMPNPVAQPLDVVATSYGHVAAAEPLSAGMRRRDTRLPPGRNPRTVNLARELRAAHSDDVSYVDAVLDLFHSQEFFYTLTPPRLGADSVDNFLFDTRRGFCGHYASAFAALMRAVGIPARVVTGYQGGTYNRFADYWILRQSDAHAWDEIWLEGRGWVRVDPTSVIAPERVEHGLTDLVRAGAPLTSRWQQRTPWFTDARLRLDALRLLWRERILRFDQGSQERLLTWLHIPEPDGQKVALVLAVCLVLGMGWLTWSVRRELDRSPRDPLQRAYARLCARLRTRGFERQPAEGAEAFAARVGEVRPDLASSVIALGREYSSLRYGAEPRRESVERFAAAVRAFHPSARPQSRG